MQKMKALISKLQITHPEGFSSQTKSRQIVENSSSVPYQDPNRLLNKQNEDQIPRDRFWNGNYFAEATAWVGVARRFGNRFSRA